MVIFFITDSILFWWCFYFYAGCTYISLILDHSNQAVDWGYISFSSLHGPPPLYLVFINVKSNHQLANKTKLNIVNVSCSFTQFSTIAKTYTTNGTRTVYILSSFNLKYMLKYTTQLRTLNCNFSIDSWCNNNFFFQPKIRPQL